MRFYFLRETLSSIFVLLFLLAISNGVVDGGKLSISTEPYAYDNNNGNERAEAILSLNKNGLPLPAFKPGGTEKKENNNESKPTMAISIGDNTNKFLTELYQLITGLSSQKFIDNFAHELFLNGSNAKGKDDGEPGKGPNFNNTWTKFKELGEKLDNEQLSGFLNIKVDGHNGFVSSKSNKPSYPSELVEHCLRKAEEGWLERKNKIDSLCRSGYGEVDSSIMLASGFNKPNLDSIAISNTSILLEMATREFVNSVYENDKNKRVKRNTRFASLMRFQRQNDLRQIDVRPFTHPVLPQQCADNDETLPCNLNTPYRTFSGFCNNIHQPTWGKSISTFDRLIPSAYEDGISLPRSTSLATGKPLPSPRYISQSIHIDVSHLSNRHTLMFMQYAQFLDHDITHTPVNPGSNGVLKCRDCDSQNTLHPECWPINVPQGDSYYPSQNTSTGRPYCIPFTRSLAGQQRLGPREQINQNSAYIDSSHIYGETLCKAKSLRGERGTLNVTFSTVGSGKNYMPQIPDSKQFCKAPSGYCFYAGDPRASEQPGLAAVHTVFLREHNRIANQFSRINPHWDDDKIYQETRRIIQAMNQHITYNELLPRLLGAGTMHMYGLQLQNDGYYNGYDNRCAANIYNVFAAAAFRFGHSLIRPHLFRMDNRYNGMNPHIQLRDGFFNSDMLYKPFMIDEIVRGLAAEPMEQLDPFITNEITNHLFEDHKKSFSGMDLIALNIHRGRDHGLPSYNEYRQYCGLKKARSFLDLHTEIPTEVVNRLHHVYESPDDIDIFSGSLVEKAVPGGLIGPTMSCIIATQFKKLRDCDRFWYETGDAAIKFSIRQLAEIRKMTLSKVVCENMDHPEEAQIQKSAFDAPHNFLNPRMPCNRLPSLDLELWREIPPEAANHPGCILGGKRLNLGESALPTPCVSCICAPHGTKCASLKITSCEKLFMEARREDIMGDNICMSQCGFFFGEKENRINYNDQNSISSSIIPTRQIRFNSDDDRGNYPRFQNRKRTGYVKFVK